VSLNSEQQEVRGEPFRIVSAEFLTSAVNPSQYPPPTVPEVAFAGKSNVGKSSLINTLLNRKRLVKTSNTPGRTQLVNFFEINRCFRCVDLPGYGFARVPANVKKKWATMIETYLANRQNLLAVVLIMDIRRIPDKKDQELMGWLRHHQKEIIFVLTKADKLSKNGQRKQMLAAAEELNFSINDFILFSGKTGMGKAELWEAIRPFITTPQIGGDAQ
jgi:GTP-binding protein